MDLDYVLLWFALLSSGIALARLLRLRPRPRGWIGVHLGILLVTLGAASLLPFGAGLLGGSLWLLFFLLPARFIVKMQRAMLTRDFAEAQRLARWAARLHPFDGYQDSPDIVAALALVDAGRFVEAEARLARSPQVARAIARTAFAQSFRQRADWKGALDYFPLPLGEDGIGARADEVLLHVRALGESGNLERLAWVFERVDAALDRARRELERNALRSMVLAFAGRREALDGLLAGPLQFYPKEIADYWRAVAAEAAGDPAAASAGYQRLVASGSLLTREASRQRLALGPAAPARLPESLPPLLARIEREIDQERRFGLRAEGAQQQPVATLALIALNLLVFVFEIALGGSENPLTLARMGALLPHRVLAGEWWRLPAAMFLHFGWLHLFMNMYGLWLLGPFAERSVGAPRFTLSYLGSGLGSMAGVVWLASRGRSDVDLLVGASGAVLGVVGATAAILLRGWIGEHAPVARRRLANVALIVALQVLFDRLTPIVSGAAHLWGMGTGFVLTLALEAAWPRRPPSSIATGAGEP